MAPRGRRAGPDRCVPSTSPPRLAQGARIALSGADRAVLSRRRIRLAVVGASPAGNLARLAHRAGVMHPGAHRAETPGERIRLAVLAVPPAHHLARVAHGAGMTVADADGAVEPRRCGLAQRRHVLRPARHLAPDSSNRAGTTGADAHRAVRSVLGHGDPVAGPANQPPRTPARRTHCRWRLPALTCTAMSGGGIGDCSSTAIEGREDEQHDHHYSHHYRPAQHRARPQERPPEWIRASRVSRGTRARAGARGARRRAARGCRARASRACSRCGT